MSLAQELREHVKHQKSSIDFVIKNLADARIVGAVLHAPSYLSGLSDAEHNVVREIIESFILL